MPYTEQRLDQQIVFPLKANRSVSSNKTCSARIGCLQTANILAFTAHSVLSKYNMAHSATVMHVPVCALLR